MARKERFFWLLGMFALFAAFLIVNLRSARVGADYADYINRDTTAKRWRGKDSANYAQVKVTPMPAAIFNSSKDTLIKRLRDSLKDARNLIAHFELHATTSGTVKAPVIRAPEDTCIGLPRFFEYRDKYLSMRGLIDTVALIDYEIANPLGITYAWRRPGFLKKKELTVQIRAENPATTVGAVQVITIAQPRKRWYETRAFAFGLGFVAGVAAEKYLPP